MAAKPKSDGSVAPADFDAFFTQHERALYSYLRRLLPSEEVAVEIAQETFFRAWTHFEEIRSYDRPEAWLYRVATNLAISALRRRQPVPLSRLLDRRGARDEYGEPDESMSALLTAPLDIEEQTAERDAISRVLSRLSERERAALLLRAVQGFSHEEIAGALGISTSNARQVLARGRQRFRQLYDGEGERESVV